MPATPSGTLQGPPDQQIDPFESVLERPVGRRFLLFKGGLLAAFGILTVRLWQMQIAQGREYAAQAEKNRVAFQTVPAPRGVIYDRNGIVLAGNKANWQITIVPANLPKEEAGRAAVFAELDRRLAPPWVLLLSPRRLPTSPEAALDIYARIAAALGRPTDEVVAAVQAAVAADQIPVLSDEIPSENAVGLQKALAGLPGVMLFSQPEYRVWSSGVDPRRRVVVHSGVTRDVALSLESRSLLLPGVGIQADSGRAYPSGSVAAHVVGYVGRIDPETQKKTLSPSTGQPLYDLDDTSGQTGMEAVLESVLRGRKGYHVVEVDINHRIVRELSSQPPAPGASAALTIDLGVQKEATDALNEALDHAGVASGAVVAIDPTTGEVLALVSLPAFNSQDFGDGMSTRAYSALINDPNQPLFNRCVGGLYAPGACYKPFVALAALKENLIDGATVHICKGGVHIPVEYNEITRQYFGCWQPAGHGPLTVVNGLAQSCDVFAYNLIVPAVPDARGKNLRYYETEVGGSPIEFKGLGIERINAFVRTAGLGQKLGIELSGEQAGLLPDQEWKRQQRDRGVWTLADTIGHGNGRGDLQVTPLQMAAATAAIANGGTVYRPRLLKSILREGNSVIEEQPPLVVGHIDAGREQIELVRQGMRGAVATGVLAGRLSVPEVATAGMPSLATTEAAGPTSPPTKPHAWCTAFAPFDSPRIAVAVLLERAGDGATHAAPVAERVLRAFFRGRQRS